MYKQSKKPASSPGAELHQSHNATRTALNQSHNATRTAHDQGATPADETATKTPSWPAFQKPKVVLISSFRCKQLQAPKFVTRRKEFGTLVFPLKFKYLLVCRNEGSRKGTDVAYNVLVVAHVIPIQAQPQQNHAPLARLTDFSFRPYGYTPLGSLFAG